MVKMALVPLNWTSVAPEKSEPVIVTSVPTGPSVGANPVIVGTGGGEVTVKASLLVAVPSGVTTEMGPVVAPSGTTALIWVSESMVKMALVPLNWTSVAPEKSEPVIVTSVPTGPSVGANPVIVGTGGGEVTVKASLLVAVPSGVTTEMCPVVAPSGTTALIWVSS